MVQRIVVTDDLGGSEGIETVAFGYEGTRYEIDLTGPHRAAFEQAIAPYVEAARQVGARRASPRRPDRGRRAARPDPSEVRAWAAENGIEVPARGRLGSAVVERYLAAH